MTDPSSVSATGARTSMSPSRRFEARLVQVQAIAGGLFFIFLVLHLVNTALAVFGPEVYNGFQRWVQPVYQHPVLELLLVLGPLVTHAIVGVWLALISKRRNSLRPLRYRLQSWAGFFLLAVVFGHVLATRGVGYFYGAVPGFAGVSFSIWWQPVYFYPYYFLLFMAGAYHGTMGVGAVLRRLGMQPVILSGWQRGAAMLLGASLVSGSLLAFGGVLFEIEDPRDNDYARQYGEFFSIDLDAE